MRIKRILAASLFLLASAGVYASVQDKTPVDTGCPTGEWWCETTPQWSEVVNGQLVVHAPVTRCECR